MFNMNRAIGNNISRYLKKIGKSPSDLAGYLGTTRLAVGNMLDGSRTVNAINHPQGKPRGFSGS